MTSVEEQNRANKKDAEREGIQLGEPYGEERDISASRYSNKTRDGFEGLLADLESGTFGADILYLWESSRGSRKVGEWVTLIDLCEMCGVLIRVTTHGRTYDPRNGRDRRTLLEDAVDSEYESYKISTRCLRTAEEMAADGRPTGRAPWGYQPVYDVRSGALITWEPDPETAPYIRELFERIAAGHTQRAIADDWTGRGIRSATGKAYTQQSLRRLLVRPAYAGLRVHRGQTTQGTWEALISAELWHTVQRIMHDPQRLKNRNGRARHLLTMIIRCDDCGGPMVVRKTITDYERYRCRDCGRVSISEAPVDEIVVGAILAYLSREDVYQSLNAGGEDSPELAEIRERIAATRAELAEAENTEPETVFEAKQLAKLVGKLTQKISDLEQQERELTTPSALRRLIEPGADVSERWDQLPLAAKREVARILLSPELLGEVRIKKTGKAAKLDASYRVKWLRASA